MKTLPAVANHADSFAFSHAVESSTPFQIFFASNPLRIAEASFRQSISIAPRYKYLGINILTHSRKMERLTTSDFEASQREDFILLNTPAV